MQTITTYRKSGRLLILRVIEISRQFTGLHQRVRPEYQSRPSLVRSVDAPVLAVAAVAHVREHVQ